MFLDDETPQVALQMALGVGLHCWRGCRLAQMIGYILQTYRSRLGKSGRTRNRGCRLSCAVHKGKIVAQRYLGFGNNDKVVVGTFELLVLEPANRIMLGLVNEIHLLASLE